MLTLTNSFCRYLWFACENTNYKTHVRKFTNLGKRTTCSTDWYTQLASIHTGQVPRQKKRLRVKIPPFNSNVCERNRQMSDTEPTNNHVSHGGTFEISSDDDSFPESRRQSSDSAIEDNDQRKPHGIPPDFRLWESVEKKSETNDGTFKFKVMSYNVLAQYLLECHPYLYTDCSARNLKWKVRAARLYEEIMTLAPDILCLQEVQASHLNSYYSKFEQIGYFGIFKQKTGHRQDGCAIYFKQSLFEMEDHVSVEFYQPELPILNRDNIGIMVKLVPRVLPTSPIIVATTHLLYNPKRTDVRLAQIQVLLAEIDRFAYYCNGRESGHLPIILTGDFNSMPESAVINLLDKGHVRATPFRDSSDWKRIGVTDNCQHLSVYLNRLEGRSTDFSNVKIYNSDYCATMPDTECSYPEAAPSEEFSALFNSGVIGHSLKLASAYDKYKCGGEYEASTYQDYWVTVDYIYFSCCSALKLVERLRLPTVSECEVLGRLPNDVYGSDHLALAVGFELASPPPKSAL